MMVAALGFHRKIALHLERSGFTVRRVVRQRIHPIWEAHLNRGTILAGEEEELLRSEIWLFLKQHGHRCPRKEIDVSAHGDRLRASFLWDKGEVGWMSFYRGRREWHPGHPY